MIPESIKANKLLATELQDRPTGSATSGGYRGDALAIKRSDLDALIKATIAGLYPTTRDEQAKCMATCIDIRDNSQDERNRLKATQLYNLLDMSNVKRLEVVDKMCRLDSGDATEITHGVMVNIMEVEGPRPSGAERLDAPETPDAAA